MFVGLLVGNAVARMAVRTFLYSLRNSARELVLSGIKSLTESLQITSGSIEMNDY